MYLIFTHSTIAKNQVKVDVVKYNTSIIEKTHILSERSWKKRYPQIGSDGYIVLKEWEVQIIIVFHVIFQGYIFSDVPLWFLVSPQLLIRIHVFLEWQLQGVYIL